MTLASALLDPMSANIDPRLTQCVNRSIGAFALAIYKKTARLQVHYSDGFIAETVGVVATYNLDSEADMSSLLHRVQHIFTWAEEVRLRAITDLLDILDARVNFKETVLTQDASNKGPMDVPGIGRLGDGDGSPGPGGRGKSPGAALFKTVVGSSMPKWSRVEM
ncbi:uncharacterized protein AB675_3031 [Cyphellophora attinorum]|uniref:Uncharacterized protein n=1 Tax=Cyphellophora attinorum TaxID=1664694 RepID=A0A0N0NK81_9EURO|nr:uncharacterized protein AB675_3031 [Phialophora attinorum]KPI37841.1 hypothetical protein AB675_3031 [Phialophora attinorum]